MDQHGDQVLKAALALPADERARLAHELLLSLDAGDSEQDGQAIWTSELARRLREVREGTVELVDFDEVDAYVASKVAEVHGRALRVQFLLDGRALRGVALGARRYPDVGADRAGWPFAWSETHEDNRSVEATRRGSLFSPRPGS